MINTATPSFLRASKQGTEPPPALGQLTLPVLLERCREEIRSYLAHRSRDEAKAHHCYELFRRAIQERNDAAWDEIYRLYYPLVLSWVVGVDGCSLLSWDDHQEIVNLVFARFAGSVTPQRFKRFHRITDLLQYLKCCARSVSIDVQRQRRRQAHREETLELLVEEGWEPSMDDPAEAVLSSLRAKEVWQAIGTTLKDEQERVVVSEILLEGMTPKAVLKRSPTHFSSIEDVYRVQRRVLKRLEHNPDVLALLEQWGE